MPTTRVQFQARIRFWDVTKQRGLAVADIPAKFVDVLGGRRQKRVGGTINGAKFVGSTMLVRGGGFCVGITKAAMSAAGVEVGERVTLRLDIP
jgi:hypothetical protein